jgi:transcriptional regulator with XRE-family HTH domain
MPRPSKELTLDRVCRRLRLARKRLGLAEHEAAAACGITVQTYRKYEAGRLNPATCPVDPFVRFAKKFGVIDWFFEGKCSPYHRAPLRTQRSRELIVAGETFRPAPAA